MRVLLASWFCNALTLYILGRLLPDKIIIKHLVPAGGGFISTEGLVTVLVGALILGILNAVLKPVISLLSLPVTCLTLGLFSFVVTGIVFYIAASITPGMAVANFWWAILGGALFGFLNSIISGLLGVDKKKED
ncbi:MAG: phage holin family protein [Firmicutes bacterium]|nr:phage holin family protein [Bacillota bacterium]